MIAKLDIHTHTVSSGHAYSSLEENIRSAKKQGLDLIGFTDHAPAMPGGAYLYHFYNIRILPPIIDGIRVLKGAEANILDHQGTIDLDLDEEVLENLELVIASIHPPCYPVSTISNHTQTIIKAMENTKINIIGHPGDERYKFDIKEVVSASKETGTLLEINNSSLKPTSFRPGGDRMISQIIEECMNQDVPLIMGSDAHFSRDVGNFTEALALLNKLDFPQDKILNYSVEKFTNHTGIKH